MKPALPTVSVADAPHDTKPTFCVSRSQEAPAYHQLTLEDDQGCIANWVIPTSLKKLSKRNVLLWQLPSPTTPEAQAHVETGPVRQVPARDGSLPNLRTNVAQGLLQLNFSGHWLRGYHRLRRLPQDSGQLWQLTPIT
jgi:hypothetical protein